MARFLCASRFPNLLSGKTNISVSHSTRQILFSTQQHTRSGFTLSDQSWRSLNKEPIFCRCLGISSLKKCPQARKYSQKPSNASQEQDYLHTSASSVIRRLHEVEERMRVKGYSVLRWGLAVITVLLTTVYLFRERVRDNVADEVAGVASRSLGDENLVIKANEITKIVLQDIINDPETSRLASDFITSVLNREDLRNSAVDLTLFVLKDPSTHKKVSELAASTLRDLLNRDEIRSLLLGYIKELVLDESTRQACTLMIKNLLEEPQLKEFMAQSLANLIASSIVSTKAVELGKNVTHQVVSDTTIQKETGDVMWKVFKDSVTPSWFSSTSKPQ